METHNTYSLTAFCAMVRARLRLALDQIGAIQISEDGRTLKICARAAEATRAELGTFAIERGWHAIAKIGRNTETGTLQIDGSPGLKDNPGLAAVVAWVDGLLTEAGEDEMFCGFPPDVRREICFANLNNPTGELTFVTPDGLAQATALPAGGYVGRSTKKTKTVYYLAPEAVGKGAFEIGNWTQVPVPGVDAVTHFPERIDEQARVCVSTEIGGNEGFEVLDLEQIGQGTIKSLATGVGVRGLRYLGATGVASNFAVVDASPGTSGFKPGVTVLSWATLCASLGRVGQAMVAAA